MIRARLVRRKGFSAELEVEADGKTHLVEYVGGRLGWEGVKVDGELVKKTKSLYWFVPRFPFKLGSRPAEMRVRVWPWVSLRSLDMLVEERVVFAWRSPLWEPVLAAAIALLLALVVREIFRVPPPPPQPPSSPPPGAYNVEKP
jgi:hypothetical protein